MDIKIAVVLIILSFLLGTLSGVVILLLVLLKQWRL